MLRAPSLLLPRGQTRSTRNSLASVSSYTRLVLITAVASNRQCRRRLLLQVTFSFRSYLPSAC
jgi:hypothetical protein